MFIINPRKIAYILMIQFFVAMPLVLEAYAANLLGKVVFKGEVPSEKVISVHSDPACSEHHPDGISLLKMRISGEDGLADAFVYIQSGLKDEDIPKSTGETPRVIDQTRCMYTPHVLGMRIGETLQIKNSDPTLHNVHGLAKTNKEFNLGMPVAGMILERTFDKPEIMVKLKCEVHPWMSAYIGVLDHPFFDVTDEVGSFEIKDLPPGDYVLNVWHETLGEQQMPVTVSEGAGLENLEIEYP